jgi:predicted dehydrogenase
MNRNWVNFAELSGDHIVEQHIHNIDVINWVKKGFPVKASGMGGCEVRKGEDYGEIFDHHAVEFEYADGTRCSSFCRHIVGCWNSVSEHVVGTKGTSNVGRNIISPTGGDAWRFDGKGEKDAYQVEHDVLFEAIRNNKEHNEAELGAMSTATAILGREATYSGVEVEMAAFLKRSRSIFPPNLAWDADMPVKPGKDGIYPRAVPGQYKPV